MQRQVARSYLFANRVKVEVEAVDRVDLGEASFADATVDGASHSALLFLVAKPMQDVEGRQIVLAGTFEQRGYQARHPRKPQPSELLHEHLEQIVLHRPNS